MMLNKKIGEWGERLAAEFLTKKGYEVIERNYRFSHGEIDLIVMKWELLVFVEVKARSDLYFVISSLCFFTKKRGQES